MKLSQHITPGAGMNTLPPSMKGAPKSEILKFLRPDHTCPTINILQDYLEELDAPPDLFDALTWVRIANRDLRELLRQAILDLEDYENQ